MKKSQKQSSKRRYRLECFLYLLMRDHLVPGAVEQIVMDVEKVEQPPVYSNRHLLNYARELVARLEAK